MASFFTNKRAASQPFILFTLFLDVLGIGLIIPVLPALIGQFTQSADQQAHWYGWLAATYGVAQFFFTPLLGALSDRFGRRPLLLLSIFGLGLGFLLQGLATSLMMLLVVRIFSGATAASFAIANAYTADVTPPGERAKAFGLLGAAFGIGFIIGPVLGGILSDINIHLPFYFAASLSLLNWLYGYFFLPESLAKEKRAPFSIKRANPFSALAHLGKLRSIGGLVGAFALTVFAQFILQTTWVLYTHFRFGWSPKQNGYALFVVGIVSVIVQGGLQSRLLKVLGETRLTLIGITSGVLAFAGYGLATQGWMMYCIIFANFMSFAVAPTLQSIISKAVGANEQGVTQGALSSINSVAIIFAPLLGSTLLSLVSHLPGQDWRLGATFYACSAFQLAGLVFAIVHFRQVAQTSSVIASSAVQHSGMSMSSNKTSNSSECNLTAAMEHATKAVQDVGDLLRIAIDHSDERAAIVVYDVHSELAVALTSAYRANLPRARFIDFDQMPPDGIIAAFDKLASADLVVLIQSTHFRLNAYRVRVELFKLGLKVIEHPHLARMVGQEAQVYLESLAYDPAYYRGVGNALKSRIDAAQSGVVESGNGERLVYAGPFESAKLNIGDYSNMPNIGGQFPIGEVFTEAKNLEAVNGRVRIFVFGDTTFSVNRPEQPITLVVTCGQVTDVIDSTSEFDTVISNIRNDEGGVVWLRELGFGMNRAFSRERIVSDIGTYERMCGIHLSLGSKHGIYGKPGFKRNDGKHHVDVFAVTETVYLDEHIVYQNGAWIA